MGPLIVNSLVCGGSRGSRRGRGARPEAGGRNWRGKQRREGKPAATVSCSGRGRRWHGDRNNAG